MFSFSFLSIFQGNLVTLRKQEVVFSGEDMQNDFFIKSRFCNINKKMSFAIENMYLRLKRKL